MAGAAPALRRPLSPGGRSGARGDVLPGFRLTMGITLLWLALIVLLPLAALALQAADAGPAELWRVLQDERVQAALQLSFGTAAMAAAINAVFGTLVAWVLVRRRFPGRGVLDAAVDLPFALPTAVAGIALTTLYDTQGWIGGLLAPLGIDIAFTFWGIVVALVFVGLPFVVRSVQPVLMDLPRDVEEAAASLGASRGQCFRRVVLPALLPSIVTGATLAFARAVGEYGSVIFIAGNMPYRTEIAPLLIAVRLEEFDYTGAAVIATIMLGISFLLLLALSLLQGWRARRLGDG